MNTGNNIQEELRELGSPLADMSRDMPYSVPHGYFSQLPGIIEENIAGNIVLEAPKYNTPYSTPSGYFEGFPAQLMETIKAREIGDGVQAKGVISFRSVKWSVAAILALVISFGGYITFTDHSYNGSEHILASVPGSEINDYIQQSYGLDVNSMKSDIDISTLNINNKDIVAYLNETGWE